MLSRSHIFIVSAVVALVAWWLMRRPAAAAGAAPGGQFKTVVASVPKLTISPMATQGTQTQKPRLSLARFDSPTAGLINPSMMPVTRLRPVAGMPMPRIAIG